MLSYGADPYTAESVSWHVPGIASSVDSLLGFNTTSALHHLQAVQQENPGLSAASIAWIGYDAPSGWSIMRAAGHGMARTGGDILYSDIRAFNAARDALAGDGTRFTGNHVFGYSYGSTTTGYAGRDGRFAGHVRTVSLVGSPGAGPVRTAGEFAIGAENVFVASSSRDVVTALGGRTSGSNGRILGIGLGTDPAMDSFGAVRVTAEAPAVMNRMATGGTHHTYFLDTEATTNLGRIAAGRTDAVTTEQHRTELGRSRRAPLLRTVEPAGDRVGGRRFWNALWCRPPNCVVTLSEELSSLFGRKFGLDVRPSRRGVPARALFQSVRSDADFATYDEIEATLLGDPSLKVAVVTSQWSGGRQSGHAYMAVKIGRNVQLYDPHTRKYSPWPPHWGQNAVTQTAVGYLRTNGNPVGPMTVDVPLRLDAADAVGNVQGPQTDPEFSRRQAEYRAQDPATRLVDTRYAEPLGDVVDNASDHARVRQLAQDLSGRYGPYRIQLTAENLTDEVLLTGAIFNGDTKIGTIQRSFSRDSEGNLVAYHTGVVIKDKNLRGQGFSKALTSELERFYVHSGVDRIELTTHDKGAYAWARRGYAWDPGTRQLQESLDRVKQSARELRETVSDEAKALLDQVVQQLDPSNPRLPEPIDLANLATTAEPKLGRDLLDGTGAVPGRNGVHYVKYLDPAPVAPTRTGLKGWIQNVFGRDSARSRADDNCAYGVAGELSRIHPGRRFILSVAPSSTGVPGWALFQAAESRSQFATYDEIQAELLGPTARTSAIVVSRWAADSGRQGGHAYLAVTDGQRVQLYDPRTRRYSPWPPYWGEAAVDRTAVGYLDENGEPVDRLSYDVPLQISLDAADAVGDVRGAPSGSDFPARQQDYREQDPTTRRVDTRYAQPLGEVVDNFDADEVRQLADDLSGVYGPYRVEMFRAVAEERSGGVIVGGLIISGDEEIGFVQQTYVRDRDGSLVAHQNAVDIPDRAFRGQGFSKALSRALEQYYTMSGVDRIELRTEQDGGYAWARQGFSWNPDPQKLQASVDNVRNSALRLRDQVSPEARAVLDELVQRLDPSRADLPEPVDIAALVTVEEPHLGRDVLTGTHWSGVKYLGAADAIGDVQGSQDRDQDPGDTDQARADYRAQDPRTRRVDTRYAQPLDEVIDNLDRDEIRRLADDLSGRYGPYRVEFEGSILRGYDKIVLEGVILHGNTAIGSVERTFYRDDEGKLVVYNILVTIDEDYRGKGFSKAFTSELERYYTRSGVDRIELLSMWHGSNAWARRGFTWDPDLYRLQESLQSVKANASRIRNQVSPEAQAILDEVVARLEPGHSRLPEPADLAALTTSAEPKLGRQLLYNTSIRFVGYIEGAGPGLDFSARQEIYRAHDPTVRRVDAGYADSMGDLVDSLDAVRITQLARDLSGTYGPYRVEFRGEAEEDVFLSGVILNGDNVIGKIAYSFFRDGDGLLVAHHEEVRIFDNQFRGQGFSKAFSAELESYYRRSGVDRIVLVAEEDGGNAWARRGFTWDREPERLARSLGSVKDAAQVLREQVSPEARALLDEIIARLEPDHPRLPEPIDLASLASAQEPALGRQLMTDTGWFAVKYVGDVSADPVRVLGLLDHQPGTLSEGQAIAAFSHGELRMREFNEQLAEAGVSAETRARQLSELRNSLRTWAYQLMSNQVAAEFLSRITINPTFEDLVTRNAERGLTGDAIFEAIIDSSTHSRLEPGSLSDIETGAVYSQFELGLRALNEQMVSDGLSAEDRARTLSGLRSSLRAWTRELMENRSAADWMAANESNPSFEDLVARYERKGLSGDAVYEAIIDGATHSHYAAGTLTDEQTRTVYTTYEMRMRELRDQLLRDGVGAEERARTMYGMRATIRTWTRSLMADREMAEWLNANEPNPTFDQLVERNRAKGRVGDEIYEAIVDSSTRSRGSVNAGLGIDPDNPPDLPPMRGPDDDGSPPDQDQEEDTT
nr:alpha/beta hydrolase [Mycobacterium sp. DL99]